MEVSLSLPPPPTSPINGDSNGDTDDISNENRKPFDSDSGTNGNGISQPNHIGSLAVANNTGDSM